MKSVNKKASIKDRIDFLASIKDRIDFLRYCSNLYETNGTSPISDEEYDKEYYELKEICPDDEFFSEVGGLDKDHMYGTPVKHEIIMGSLSKCLDIDMFDKWLRSNFNQPPSFVLQHKIDGLSLSLIYENGKLSRATTRGDGTTGIDVTKNAMHVKGVLHTIKDKNKVEIRGECFKDKKDFYEKWHQSVMKNGEKGYKNPRNFSAGSINQLDPEITKKRELEFVAYEVVQKDFDFEIDKNKYLSDMGFPTLNESTRVTKSTLTFEQIVNAVKIYMDKIDRANLPYDIDGIVVKLNNVKKAKSMGTTTDGRKPKSSRAVKFPPEKKETKVIGVETSVGRTGNIIPVAILEPIELGGATISRATLHNYGSLINENSIKLGAIVVVSKAGDIIPKIDEIKKNGTKNIDIPTHCPSCGSKLSWDKNKVHLVCENINCPAQLSSKIDHWVKKIGVKGIGKGILDKLTNEDELSWENRPIITTLSEIYYMLDNDRKSEHPFRKYNYLKKNFGEKTYDNMVKNIKAVNELPLNLFIEALGIGKIGSMSKEITNVAPTIEEIDQLTVEDLVKIDGFAQIKAENFVNGWAKNRKEIGTLLKHIKITKDKKTSDKLKDKSFCFTGSFGSPSRKEMEKMVVENGGKLSSVSKKLTALVWDEETTKGKYDKATKLNVPIISQKDFLKLV